MERKSGFTLIELLVYIAIMGFIIVVAGRVFSDSTIMRVRSQNMIKTSETLGKVSDLLKEDISQMGTKWEGKSENNEYKVVAKDEIYWNGSGGDSSSYELIKGSSSEEPDNLTFIKAEFNENGEFQNARKISWYAREDSLFRGCEIVDGTADDCVEEVLISENITRFNIFPSKPGRAGDNDYSDIDTLYPNTKSGESSKMKARDSDEGVAGSAQLNKNLAVTEDEGLFVVEGFSQNTAGAAGGNPYFEQAYLLPSAGASWKNCSAIPFEQGKIYAFEFDMKYKEPDDNYDTPIDFNDENLRFVPGTDHISIGLRNNNGDIIPGGPADALIYPPQTEREATIRHIEFSVSRNIDACVALTFSIYTPNIGKKLFFRNFKVLRKSEDAFHFPKGNYGAGSAGNDPTKIKEKMSVKAFQVLMDVENKGEKATTYTIDENGNENGMVITAPNNGRRKQL